MAYAVDEKVETTQKIIGYVGVDAGMLMITDPSYVSNWVDNEMGDASDGHYSWAGAVATTHGSLQGGSLNYEKGHDGQGVVFRTGLGDGYYPVIGHYAKLDSWGERIVKIEVIFLQEDTDE
jgi:hypothetical protein